jgi:hypothetical protein
MKGFIAPIGIVGLIVLGIVLTISLPTPIYGYILIGTTIIASMSIFIGLRIRQQHREQQKQQQLSSIIVI